jgi:hypothetical protein
MRTIAIEQALLVLYGFGLVTSHITRLLLNLSYHPLCLPTSPGTVTLALPTSPGTVTIAAEKVPKKKVRRILLLTQNILYQPCNPEIASGFPGKSCLVAAAATTPVAAAIHLAVAIGAIDRLVATRYERYFGVLAAVGAYHLRHCALGATVAATTATAVASATAVATIATTVATLIACCFLGGAAIGATCRLAVALLRIKILLTLGKGKCIAAIAAR